MNRVTSGSRWGAMLLAGAVVFLCAQPGEAKILELWVQGQGGGLYGFYGTEDYDPGQDQSPAEDDFFAAHSGGACGVHAGV